MGITTIDNGSYFGLRVTRVVKTVKHTVHFTLRAPDKRGKLRHMSAAEQKEVWAKAKEMDAELKREQRLARTIQDRQAVPKGDRSDTGVVGINVVIKAHPRGDAVYYYPTLQVATVVEGKYKARSVRLQRGSEQSCWERACDVLATMKQTKAVAWKKRFPGPDKLWALCRHSKHWHAYKRDKEK